MSFSLSGNHINPPYNVCMKVNKILQLNNCKSFHTLPLIQQWFIYHNPPETSFER